MTNNLILMSNLFLSIQTYLDEAQISSNRFVRALMTSVCQSVMSCKYDWQPQSGSSVLLELEDRSFDGCSGCGLTESFFAAAAATAHLRWQQVRVGHRAVSNEGQFAAEIPV